MRKLTSIPVLSLFLPLALVACTQQNAADTEAQPASEMAMEPDVSAIRAQIDQIRQAWVSAAQQKDAAAIAALYSDNAMFVSDNGQVVTGKAGIQEAMGQILPMLSSIQANPTDFQTDGTMATEVGEYTNTVTPPDGKAQTITGHYLVVSKKQADGSWKIIEHLNAVPMAEPTAPGKM